MKLRKEFKIALSIMLLSQISLIGLKLVNNNLERELAILEVKASDYQVNSQITRYEPKNSELEPCSTSSAKSYMDYTKITSKTSDQFKYIQEHMEVVDGYLLDKYGNYGVALGSYFGDIGSRYVFTLDTGIEIPVVKIEVKDDSHTINGCEHKIDSSVIEFVIDINYFDYSSNGYIYNGNFNNNYLFNGNIERIVIVE